MAKKFKPPEEWIKQSDYIATPEKRVMKSAISNTIRDLFERKGIRSRKLLYTVHMQEESRERIAT